MKDSKIEILNLFEESSNIIRESKILANQIQEVVKIITTCLKNGKKILIFGNGGSAADAQHIAAELIGRYLLNRQSFSAIALTTDTSVLTSLSNDFSYDVVFRRQCESLVSNGDVVIGISTSGNSKSVKKGIETANKKGAITIGLLGNKGGTIKKSVHIPIIVNSSSTPRIQEVHRVIYHIICEMVEKNLVKNERGNKNN